MSMLYLKGSFEDEGLNNFEVQILSSFAKQLHLPLAFKIGGCEAKSDIFTALNYGATCVVAPMVESEFAVSKFISAVTPHREHFRECNINIETITAVERTEEILKKHYKNINGVVVGRTDLALSMGLTKKDVDSEPVLKIVEKTLKIAKNYGLKTTMGGSVNSNSLEFIHKMNKKAILDRFETRKVIMKTSNDYNQLKNLLSKAFQIESRFLDRTLVNYHHSVASATNRSKSIKERGQ